MGTDTPLEAGTAVQPRKTAGIVGRFLFFGAGDPEGVQVARQGAIYFRADGDDATTLYAKTTGGVDETALTATGWEPVAAGVSEGEDIDAFILSDVGRIRSVDSLEPAEDHGRAMGRDCVASDQDAWAEGNSTTASGPTAHAEGNATTAYGYASHAEGGDSQATGNWSHAEGRETEASGDQGSHAEGHTTLASGESSHAEGAETTATAAYSHAEGYQSDATGAQSHAEGQGTTASGDGSHAEGFNTSASGDYGAHAEGRQTAAEGDYSHAEGRFATAALKGEHAHGSHDFGQYSRYSLALQTEDDAILNMKRDVSLISSGSFGIPVPEDEVWMIVCEVAAKGMGETDAIAGFRIAGLVGYVTGILTLVDTPTVGRWDTTGAALWEATIGVSGTNMEVIVQGGIAQTINWVATVHATRVYAAELGS